MINFDKLLDENLAEDNLKLSAEDYEFARAIEKDMKEAKKKDQNERNSKC